MLNDKTLDPLESYSYSQLSAFGEDGGYLVLVTCATDSNPKTEKLLLAMPKAKVSHT